MYGHSHTGLGALVLALAAGAKGGSGHLVRVLAYGALVVETEQEARPHPRTCGSLMSSETYSFASMPTR